MIRPLRQRHRRIFTVLAMMLPVVFAFGVIARKLVPTVESLPVALMPKTAVYSATIWSQNDLFGKTPVRSVLLRERADAGRYAIQLFAPATFAKPDLLVYWSPQPNELKNEIPKDAVLLGAFSESVPLLLPSESSSIHGTVVLYSLADGEVVDAAKPISPQ